MKVPASGKALGKIAITQGVEVGDVVIEVQKPLVMADAEKTTYSVEDDPQENMIAVNRIEHRHKNSSINSFDKNDAGLSGKDNRF